MKKYLLIICVFVFSFTVKAQWVSLPDTNLGTWLNNNFFSQCLQGNNAIGWQLDTTCPAVTSLSLSQIYCDHAQIRNLQGIQYFKHIRFLECPGNLLQSIPQLPNELLYFDCSNNFINSFAPLPNGLNTFLCGSNWLTALPVLPDSLRQINCINNQLTALPALPSSLTSLACGNNQINALPVLPSTLSSLTCGHNPTTLLPVLPAALRTLYCDHLSLGALPTLPSGLYYLDCQFNHISSISSFPTGLISVNCSNNNLTALPALGAALGTLRCDYNQLAVLPVLPDSLKELYCGVNHNLNTLPALPPALVFLYCYDDSLTALPSLPSTLRELNASANFITNIPALPAGLQILGAQINRLTSLPVLPNGITTVACGSNLLTTLPPVLPNSLTNFSCDHNQLTSLPVMPNGLVYLFCQNNQIHNLPELPDSLYSLNITANPITCLPNLKRVNSLYFDSTYITCLPDVSHIIISTPSLDSIPLCDSGNINGCAIYWNIRGKIYDDANSNCLQDINDNAVKNVSLRLSNGNILLESHFTGIPGNYTFQTDTFGTYMVSIDTTGLPFTITCPASGIDTVNVTPVDSLISNVDFALGCKPGFDLIAQSIYSRFRPGNVRQVDISAGDYSNFYGLHCAAGVSGNVQLIITGAVTYISPASGALSPSTINGDTITWNIADFSSTNLFSSFNIILQTDTNAPLGSDVCFTLIVNPISGDYHPANNILFHCFTVVASFDPNEKEVYPTDNIDTAQKWLTYTIHFQNTGTAEAQHIYVDDTLDTDLDASSFQLLAYSHQPLVQIKGNNVRFNFPNINLPDSNTNEPASHGYVQYKVKLKNNLPIGTTINNTAYIYFDFNAPVVTNTTTNTITSNTGINQFQISNPKFQIFPNPASNSLNIVVDEAMVGSTIAVSDVTGRVIIKLAVQIQNSKLEIQNLTNGIYFVTISKDGTVSTQKLIVQH